MSGSTLKVTGTERKEVETALAMEVPRDGLRSGGWSVEVMSDSSWREVVDKIWYQKREEMSTRNIDDWRLIIIILLTLRGFGYRYAKRWGVEKV